MKGHRRIPALTAYDYPLTNILDDAGIPLILVGDSLGMVVLGYPDTTQVTLSDMEHHVRAAARAKPRALLAADLPYHSYDNVPQALESARRLVAAGAEAVKLEGGVSFAPHIQAIVAEGIPVIGHLGMLPQSVHELGGYKVQGKEESSHQALLNDMRAIVDAGVFAVVLELVTGPVAAELTRNFPVPTIGIGAGQDCDGQILVTPDLLGTSYGFIPKHVKDRGDLRTDIARIVTTWKDRVTQATSHLPSSP